MIRILLVVTSLAACVPDAPAEPSFQLDVLPILAANCVRCHGYPALGGAPPEFRLDAFADLVVRDGAPHDGCGEIVDDPTRAVVVCGAATRAALSSLRTRDEAYPMPPRFPLDDYQIEVLEQWARDPVRGQPRANNRAPTIEIVDRIDDTTRVVLRLVVHDEDGDIVSGGVHARLEGSSGPPLVVGAVAGGHFELVWDTVALARGTYRLVATLDDGAAAIEIEMGSLILEEAS